MPKRLGAGMRDQRRTADWRQAEFVESVEFVEFVGKFGDWGLEIHRDSLRLVEIRRGYGRYTG